MFPMSQPLTLVCLQDGNILFWNRATSTLQHFIQNTEFIWREKLKNLNKSVPYAIVTLMALILTRSLRSLVKINAIHRQCMQFKPVLIKILKLGLAKR